MKYPTVLFLFLVFFSCKKDDDSKPAEIPPFEQTFPISYQVEVEAPKLPFPHHDPVISSTEYEQLNDELFIINNYGQYQCGENKEECYFHDGLDIVLDNGTPIFAVKAGKVKSNLGSNEFYRTLVVEDADAPGHAWAYTHVYNFEVFPGDIVEKGQFLGRVNFQGIEHIHLSRVRLADGGSWNNYSDLIHVYPDDHFILKDETAPIIDSPFLFFSNNTDNQFEHGAVDTVSGEVDIVVRMRDTSPFSKGDVGGGNFWGDRLCVKRIEYSIRKDGTELVNRSSFDFSKMEFQYSPERWREAGVVFKFHLVADPGHSDFNRFLSNYIITNARDSLEGQIDLNDTYNSWNTLEMDSGGQPVFSDGLYEVEVRAWDGNENRSTLTNEVYVKNN